MPLRHGFGRMSEAIMYIDTDDGTAIRCDACDELFRAPPFRAVGWNPVRLACLASEGRHRETHLPILCGKAMA